MFEVESAQAWRALCPALHVEAAATTAEFPVGGVDGLLNDLRVEGYVNVAGVIPQSVVGPLREGVETLRRVGLPVAFAFVFDEFWLVFRGLSGFIGAVLGDDYCALPSFWVWHLAASDRELGFEPHRDNPARTLGEDNSPHSLTVWLALSDATPRNGCIYVVPMDRYSDEGIVTLQNVRALPAAAGSLLAWNHTILHWGGRSSRRAQGPRVSAAFEFQRADSHVLAAPLLDPGRLPPFEERLGLIGKQVLQYRHMYPPPTEIEDAAHELYERFMPKG